MVSGAVVVAQGLFAALFPSNCRLCCAPLANISRLPVCRQRGFNQAELIARKALRELPGKSLQLATDTLERNRPATSEIGLTRLQLVENLHGAFRVKHLSRAEGRDVLLVDVMTTGTTASECARLLRNARHEVFGLQPWRAR